jgi:hypothetical protein
MYSAQHYAQHDASFVQDLQTSDRYVRIAAHWLQSLGFDVRVKPLRIRPDEAHMAEFADQGDLEIIHRRRVEVKRRIDIEFTGPDDYPYPTVFVDVAHTWDRAVNKPYAYLIFNKDASVCIIVKGETAQHWIKRQHFDAAKQRERTFYECPVEFCRWYYHDGNTYTTTDR